MAGMPLFYLRRLTGSARTESGDRHLARYLAFIAGAANAGGFLAVHQYTSHMSGIVSSIADNLAAKSMAVALDGAGAVLAFLVGALFSALLIRWGRQRNLQSQYALPLLLEAVLLTAFGITGHVFAGGRVLGTVMLLCFTMGLQNAMITKLSGAVIRTTHLTGMITDIGISLGRLISRAGREQVNAEEEYSRLRLLGSLVFLFFAGGLTGAIGFNHVGFLFTVPLSVILLLLAGMPIWDDLRGAGSGASA